MRYPPHLERHFTAGETVRDIVIGMSDGLTVPFALAAGLSGAVNSTGIIVTAGAPEVPQPLTRQLADGGKLVIPVGNRQYQSLVVITRHGEETERREIEGFKFVPLIGKMGW